MSLHDLEKAVSELPTAELTEFAHWFEEYLESLWDQQIESDCKTGKLDELKANVLANFDLGRARLLPSRSGESDGVRSSNSRGEFR